MFISPIQPSIGFKSITEIKRAEPNKQGGGSIEETVSEPENKISEEHPEKPANTSKEEKCSYCKHKRNLASATGWSAASLIGLATVSGLMNSPTVHKVSAILGVTAAAAHIGIVNSHHIHSHNKKDIQA